MHPLGRFAGCLTLLAGLLAACGEIIVDVPPPAEPGAGNEAPPEEPQPNEEPVLDEEPAPAPAVVDYSFAEARRIAEDPRLPYRQRVQAIEDYLKRDDRPSEAAARAVIDSLRRDDDSRAWAEAKARALDGIRPFVERLDALDGYARQQHRWHDAEATEVRTGVEAEARQADDRRFSEIERFAKNGEAPFAERIRRAKSYFSALPPRWREEDARSLVAALDREMRTDDDAAFAAAADEALAPKERIAQLRAYLERRGRRFHADEARALVGTLEDRLRRERDTARFNAVMTRARDAALEGGFAARVRAVEGYLQGERPEHETEARAYLAQLRRDWDDSGFAEAVAIVRDDARPFTERRRALERHLGLHGSVCRHVEEVRAEFERAVAPKRRREREAAVDRALRESRDTAHLWVDRTRRLKELAAGADPAATVENHWPAVDTAREVDVRTIREARSLPAEFRERCRETLAGLRSEASATLQANHRKGFQRLPGWLWAPCMDLAPADREAFFTLAAEADLPYSRYDLATWLLLPELARDRDWRVATAGDRKLPGRGNQRTLRPVPDLLEFVHVPSALLFVLVPSKKAGEQSSQVEVPSFLISRTEVTKPSWLRLTEGLDRATHATRPYVGEDCAVVWIHWSIARGTLHRAGLDLPTDEQWVHACLAGQGEFKLEGKGRTRRDVRELKVATTKPNAWGIHDMLRATAEWCIGSRKAAPAQTVRGSGTDAYFVKIVRNRQHWVSFRAVKNLGAKR